MTEKLPDAANLEWLRKEAKRRLRELRKSDAKAQLADAQFALATHHGFSSWRALKAHVDSLTLTGQAFDLAKKGSTTKLAALLDEHAELVAARSAPYGWTLLHAAAGDGNLATVDMLLRRGLDVNAREQGDNTVPMHWAAAAGKLDVVRRLADAGSDLVGDGDDHALQIIGWASCWDGCEDDAHHAVVDFLLSRGATHHIFSAISYRLSDEVRLIVAANPAALRQPLSRNESHQTPLMFAVRRNRADMVALLLELGADTGATNDAGATAMTYAAHPNVELATIRALSRGAPRDVFAALALGDLAAAAKFHEADPAAAELAGALHLLAKRGDARGVRWLLERGVNVNARWNHWGSVLTPLHLAVMQDREDIVRLLVDAGAEASIKDSMHDSDSVGWAEFFRRPKLVRLMRGGAGR